MFNLNLFDVFAISKPPPDEVPSCLKHNQPEVLLKEELELLA